MATLGDIFARSAFRKGADRSQALAAGSGPVLTTPAEITLPTGWIGYVQAMRSNGLVFVKFNVVLTGSEMALPLPPEVQPADYEVNVFDAFIGLAPDDTLVHVGVYPYGGALWFDGSMTLPEATRVAGTFSHLAMAGS